jgi:hypothetical protein
VLDFRGLCTDCSLKGRKICKITRSSLNKQSTGHPMKSFDHEQEVRAQGLIGTKGFCNNQTPLKHPNSIISHMFKIPGCPLDQ